MNRRGVARLADLEVSAIVPPVRRPGQPELPLGLEAYRNTALFSDHFLAERLPASPWFQRRVGASGEAFNVISRVSRDVRPEETLADAHEDQCEEEIIRPVLRALGHEFLLRTPVTTGHTKNFPDYALFKDAADKDAARQEVRANNYHRAIALAEGKHWDRDLDRSVQSNRNYLTNANPSYQLVSYLVHAGQRWGILTNGRLWRLYYRDSLQPLERLYEVDLVRLIQYGGAEAFLRYFYGFFSRDALVVGAHGAHVDSVLEGSADFAAAVGGELRSRVFAALTRLAAGVLNGHEGTVSEADLDEAYDNSLIVLYRLLFVLYAEARELLPLEASASYREQLSLFQLVREVADLRDRHQQISTTSTVMWTRLIGLWRAIDEGDDDLGVAVYDGELFAENAHPYLRDHSIPNLYLGEAIDYISRVPGEIEARFVDYRSLSVTHLGTVYEGLLEHRLVVNPDRLGELEDRVELAPVRGRRRETGSYYTPDDVVQHIVRETLSPLIEARSEEEILELRIVDPALGSGHFLVAAVEFLALAIATSPDDPRVFDEEDLATIKRRVVEHCVRGVDINPLAVELAKLSLWLATASADKPLTFLDHHLRTGNSVLSLRREDVLTLLRHGEQASVFADAVSAQHERDLELTARIGATNPDTTEGIEERRHLFSEQVAEQVASERSMTQEYNASSAASIRTTSKRSLSR